MMRSPIWSVFGLALSTGVVHYQPMSIKHTPRFLRGVFALTRWGIYQTRNNARGVRRIISQSTRSFLHTWSGRFAPRSNRRAVFQPNNATLRDPARVGIRAGSRLRAGGRR